MNLDSTQDIMQNTVVGDGKWTLTLEDGTLVAQAEVPPDTKISADLIEDWCTAVRENVETLTIQRRKPSGSKQSSPGATPVDDSGISAGTVDTPASSDSSLRAYAFAEDPEGTARDTVEQLRDKHQRLIQEAEETAKMLAKWQAILKAIEDNNDEQ